MGRVIVRHPKAIQKGLERTGRAGQNRAGKPKKGDPGPEETTYLAPVMEIAPNQAGGEQLGDAMFYVTKSGFNNQGDIYMTIVLGKQHRGTALALIDQQDLMLYGTFAKPVRRPRRDRTEDVTAWYKKNIEKEGGTHGG